MPKKISKKNIKYSNKTKKKSYIIDDEELANQKSMLYWHHKMSRSVVACSFLDMVKNFGMKCDKAPVTGRDESSYLQHLFYDIKDVYEYLKNKSFLDVGCGINHIYKNALLHKLINKGYHAKGMDLYEFPDEYEHFKSGSIFKIPYPKNSFDVITSQYFLYYWIDDTQELLKAYKEMFRVLKSKGEIRIYPVYFGNFHFNDNKLLSYLFNNFEIEVIRPPFIPERVAYIYPGEGEKDIKLTDSSVPKKEKEVTENLDGTLLVLKRKY